jgi:Bacterial protein of unknown function (DUF922)
MRGMSRSDGRTRLEAAPQAVRGPTAEATAGPPQAAMLLALQQTAGNARVARMLILRDELTLTDDPATPLDAPTGGGTGGGAGGATVGSVSGRRPAVRPVTRNFANCNEAADWLNGGGDAGDASPQYHPTPGRIRHSGSAGAYTASVDLAWAYDPSSTAEMIIPAWPNMTDAERAAVARYRAAIQAHEEMHFDVTDTVVKALQRTVTATGTDPADTTRNLQAAVTQYGADAQAAIDTATHDYDATTHHGKTQSAVGGVDVHLDCSGGGGSGGSGAGSGGSSSSSPSTDASLAADLTGL